MVHNRGGTAEIRVKAAAKINVGLRILGRRPDGYHEIWSILQQIDIADDILVREGSDLSLSVVPSAEEVPEDEDNLCMKAALLLREVTGCQKGARITLNKVIPVGAGLGGGSSDAAATLMALNRLWKTGLSGEDLIKISPKLGIDVAFFIRGGCCIATGRGEILQPIKPVVSDPILLICPELRISTEWAYKNMKNYHLTSEEENIIFHNSLEGISFCSLDKKWLSNDFEKLIFDHYPSVKLLKDELLKSDAYYASLSGSGSSVFGIFRSVEKANVALTRLALNIEAKAFLLGGNSRQLV